MSGRTPAGQHLSDLVRLRRVRDRMDREYAEPLDVEALARGVNMSAVLQPAVVDGCGITDDERRTILEMMAKGTYAGIVLATKDLDATFERLQASGAEVVQEPTDQPYGVRDCAFRDPAGNLLRIQERK